MNKKITVEFCRILISIVFIFSGFVKAVDPLGFAYKIQDYLTAWNFISSNFSILLTSFFLSTLEFTLGVCLLSGVYRKVISLLTLLFMCIMTLLTLYLAITNLVSDCGCFGDILVITNWQTFYKNVMMLVVSIIIFRGHRKMTYWYAQKYQTRVSVIVIVFILSVSIYSFLYLPILDFRPYRIGNSISKLMQTPEGAALDVYETTFIYEKNGIQKSFSINNYPKGDSAWMYVKTINRLIKKGYQPLIRNFTITTEQGEDITDDILSSDTFTFLLIAHKLEETDDSNIYTINSLYNYAQAYGYRFVCLTASSPEVIDEWKASTGAEYPFCTTDDIALKTIIRSNPGLLLIRNGIIENKWSNRLLPNVQILQTQLVNLSSGIASTNHNVRNISLLVLILIIPMIVLKIASYNSSSREKRRTNIHSTIDEHLL